MSDDGGLSQTPGDNAEQPKATSKRSSMHWIKWASLAVGLVAVIGIGATFWVWRDMVKVRELPVQPTLDLEDFALTKYLGDTDLNEASFTDEHVALFERFEPELQSLDEDVKRSIRQLCEDDPHLTVSLRNPRSAPLLGDAAPRTLSQRLARKSVIVDYLMEDLEKRNRWQKDPTLRLSEQEIQYVRSFYYHSFCLDRYPAASTQPMQDAYERGVRDPLLLTAMLWSHGKADDHAATLYVQSYNSLSNRECCQYLQAMVGSSWPYLRGEVDSKTLIDAQIATREFLIDAAREHAGQDVFQSNLYSYVVRHFESSNAYGKQQWIARLIDLPPDQFPRWITHYLCYDWTRQIAEKHRGANYIRDVPKPDLEAFHHFGKLAASHLVKAWTLNPKSPHLACQLMRLSNWTSETPLSCSEWFRIGFSNECDWSYLFAEYAVTLLPQWGGSRAEILELASLIGDTAEKLETTGNGSIQTPLPLYAANALTQLYERIEQEPSSDNLQRLKPILQLVGYLKAHPEIGDSFFNDTRALIVARVLWEWSQLDALVRHPVLIWG